ncbi:MAG: hypothetical protein GY898_05585 [Proteobacteria bacterium]|nr:hypothetical protein [Pseudomonadota bacterium]
MDLDGVLAEAVRVRIEVASPGESTIAVPVQRATATAVSPWFRARGSCHLVADVDGDGFLPCGTTPDSDDTDPAVHPGAEELLCDAIDQDCDGDAAEFVDADGDGFDLCSGEDCDDGDEAVHPDAAEVCADGLDSNCDGAGGADTDDDSECWSSCTCTASGGDSGRPLVMLLLALAARRRRLSCRRCGSASS